MPTIKEFGNFKICMYFEDENSPHVHVVGSNFEAKIRIRDQAVYVGHLSRKVERAAVKYIADNGEASTIIWAEYKC